MSLLLQMPKYTATHREKSRNQLSDSYTESSKLLGKAETHAHRKPHPRHSVLQSGGNGQVPVSLWEEGLDHTYSTPAFKAAPEEWPPNHPTVRAIGTFHNESHRTRANLEAVVRWAREHSLQISPWTQRRENRQKYPFPSFFSWRRFDCTLYQLLPEGPTSNQPAF